MLVGALCRFGGIGTFYLSSSALLGVGWLDGLRELDVEAKLLEVGPYDAIDKLTAFACGAR
jgi:hypothetical protein